MTMAKRRNHLPCFLLCVVALIATLACAQTDSRETTVDVHVGIKLPKLQPRGHAPPAVLWLKPLPGTPAQPFLPNGHYALLQKNRMFTPHLLVVPVGSEVHFPNADPFFHNVFSLFNGKRFDLGLYETGTDKEVLFSREGASYIFCNIHPEMSAIVIALSTPYVSVSSRAGTAVIHGVPPGSYELHVWAEGADAAQLSSLERHVSVESSPVALGILHIVRDEDLTQHKNKFGEDYMPPGSPLY